MGCPCQGNRDVWSPPAGSTAQQAAAAAQAAQPASRRGPSIWTGRAGQPAAGQKA
jgi:hypothetical protein